MQEEEEIFNVSVAINTGLEPLTFTITTDHPASDPKYQQDYRVTRDNEMLGVLRQDADHRWHLWEGNLEQEEIEAIGQAIDAHYA
ncbi:hypothetical protein FBD94_21165 [Pedobacter hiemivivus]|uniref:Uncharacterized protein n=1 Tax=Pedobacter hiemivivus TaxID=2530454 RepID=A0A4U1G1W7_9SPHI|nr:hypothetical protein [Pedobacter hiemivivus]TKC57144.1 hypothetical protein FBD94_21165 [Pedobacter hiemivivus]